MTCRTVQHSLWAHLDGCLPEEERQRVLLHLAGCRDCMHASEQLVYLRGALKNLSVPPAPANLTTQLRVMASRERSRRVSRNKSGVLGHWVEEIRLWADNLMRPVALPFAGGFLSAVLLFGLLVPTIWLRESVGHDVPTVGALGTLFTQPTVKSPSPFGFDEDDFVVEVMIDGQGRMVDYWITQGPSLTKNSELRRSIENALVFTEFNPATAFGRATYSKMYISFSRYHINVKS